MGDIRFGQRWQWTDGVALQHERCRRLISQFYPAPAVFDGFGHLTTAGADIVDLPR
ncbi:hypothetical protein D3C84_1125060 [compost metagenome]